MSNLQIGSYVTHAKLPELGSGEIVAWDGARLSIRFSSGQREFVHALVAKHLQVTTEAPAQHTKKSEKTPRTKKTADKATTT